MRNPQEGSMKLSMLICSLLLCGCIAAAGQQSPRSPQQSPQSPSSPQQSPGTPPTFPQSSSQPRQQSAPDQSSSSQNAIQGCLSKSGDNFVLTDQSGTAYQLKGDTDDLAKYVGQEVAVSGSKAESGASSSTKPSGEAAGGQGDKGQAAASNIFTVSSVKKVADSCSASPR